MRPNGREGIGGSWFNFQHAWVTRVVIVDDGDGDNLFMNHRLPDAVKARAGADVSPAHVQDIDRLRCAGRQVSIL